MVALLATGLSGCVAHKQYRTDYALCDASGAAQCEGNALQEHLSDNGERVLLGFIEFDDQGQLWDRAQMKTVVEKLELEDRELLMIVFVHGWKHSAAPGDDNIATFQQALGRVADAEAEIANREVDRRSDVTRESVQPRQVFGIYLGWRGGSVSAPVLKELTFWNRKKTAQGVGHGGVTEVLSRLEQIKRAKDEDATAGEAGRTRLVVVGHSFGGAVAYTALAQILENRFVHATDPAAARCDIEGFGDLVVLINPAFEATLFAPLSNMSAERKTYCESQLPLLVILTSEADRATRYAFPAGRWLSTIFDKDRAYSRLNAITGEETIEGGRANRTAVGHFTAYRTHRLYPSSAAPDGEQEEYADARQMVDVFEDVSVAWASDSRTSKIPFKNLTLERTGTSAGRNPYLVASVDGRLIPGHSRIEDPRLIHFIEQLILISTQSEYQIEQSLERRKAAAR
ncbi:MAG: esterase [Thermoanaerobaculia bacterium]